MKAVLREPLLHFLVIGAVLFAWFEWRGGGRDSTHVAVTPGVVEHLASGFARTWQRPPTEAELKGLIDEHVKEEIATREAVAMGLDRDDAIIRRRLRQKIEFLVEEMPEEIPPTDAELRAWLDAHPESFGSGARLALRQVYLGTQGRGATARPEAERLLARLRAAGPDARIETLGDPSMLPTELPLGPVSEVSRTFGAAFAVKVEGLEPGRWSGPIESAYGLHLVLVSERAAARNPALHEVRNLVEREVLAERRRARLQALYARLLSRYTVTIEMPREPRGEDAAGGSASP